MNLDAPRVCKVCGYEYEHGQGGMCMSCWEIVQGNQGDDEYERRMEREHELEREGK